MAESRHGAAGRHLPIRRKGIPFRPFPLFNYAFLLLAGIVTLYPFWYVLMYSLSTYSEVLGQGAIMVPHGFTLDNLAYVLRQPRVHSAYSNTAFVVIAGTLLCVAATSTLAYPLSKAMKGVRSITLLVYLTMLFGGGMVPLYLVVRETGLLNSLWSLIIPKLVNPFYVFLMIKFFKTIPDSLVESAHIDGASDFAIFRKIVLPLSMPVMATVSLFYAVEHWNAFFDAIIYISDANKWTLQVILREMLVTNEPELLTGGTQSTSGDATAAAATGESIRMALVVVVVVPVMLIYPFLQKYFVKGVMIGAVKG